MPRIARMLVKDEPAVYHVISRTALDGYVMDDIEKHYLLDLIKHLSSIYFAEVLGFCLMGNHFHLLVRMHTGDVYSDEEIKRRFGLYYGRDKKQRFKEGQIPHFRHKWASLSEYMKEIKQVFSRFYNKLHNRKGFFWSERFKSVIVDNGETVINCLAYIDLNPVRAGIVERAEEYRWCSLRYHVQSKNKDDFLSLDFGLMEFGVKSNEERLIIYRRFVYEKGSRPSGEIERRAEFMLRNEALKDRCAQREKQERKKVFEIKIKGVDRFSYRTRYFTDAGVIGTKAFVSRLYQVFKDNFSSKHEKRPRAIQGLEGIYSLKRLSERI